MVEVPLNCWRASLFVAAVSLLSGATLDGVDLDTLFQTPFGKPLSRLILGGAYDASGRCVYMNELHTIVTGTENLSGALVEEYIDTDSNPNNT